MSDKKIYKAAMIVIGNEVLSGRTADKNINYVAKIMTEHGIRLSEVRIIPDVEHEIVGAVRSMSEKYDYVFTSGGIGPTHDDITAESVAQAFGVSVEQNVEAYDVLKDYYGENELTDARLKMACVPEGASLIDNPVSGAPGFILNNVYVMAGVPKIMQAMLDGVVGSLQGGAKMFSKTIPCNFYESQIAPGLENIQNRYPDVDIGSYPSYQKGEGLVNVVLRSVNELSLQDVSNLVAELMETL